MHIIIEGLKKEMLEKDNIIQNLQKQLVHAKLTGKTIVNKSEPEFPVVL
jgi:negative regulator of sigma E activity